MGRYERISIRPEGTKRSRTGWYEILSERAEFLLLRPVDVTGEDRSYYREDGTLVDVQEFVSVSLVTKRVPGRMNNHYAQLEVEG